MLLAAHNACCPPVVAVYCCTMYFVVEACCRGAKQIVAIDKHLFAELIGVEPTKDLTALGKEYRAQESCMVAPISYVDNQSTMRGIGIDLNVAPSIDVVGDDGYDNSDHCDHEVDSDSDPDVDEVLDDIDDEDANHDGNINASSVGN
ncbi:hypothetical protein GOBAR_DD14868 [Gossypium barbadense]|nr:hypothetical protein GOBAR_DD14868 [Gossypium barbadense]